LYPEYSILSNKKKNMDTPLAYIPRIADKMLQEQLAAAGVVLIQGPKWCGKTTTAEQQAKSVLYLDAPKTRQANMLTAGKMMCMWYQSVA